VDGIHLAVGGGVADGGFVHENPFVDGLDVGDVGHSWAGFVGLEGDVVDYWDVLFTGVYVKGW